MVAPSCPTIITALEKKRNSEPERLNHEESETVPKLPRNVQV